MTRVRSIIFALACVLATLAADAATNSLTLQYRVVDNFPVKFVAVNMNDPEVVVTPALASNFPTGLESWPSFLKRLQPDAAINGTYFCLQSNMPVGDIAVDGELLYRGVVGTALCITPDNKVCFKPGPRQAKPDWTGFRTVLCAGPRLVTDGKVTVDARAEGFRDPRVLGSAPRSAVAYREDGLLLFLTIEKNISLTNLANVCLKLGAIDAMTLDGGTSSALNANGRTVTRPGRSLSNIIAIYTSRDRFAKHLGDLNPSGRQSFASLLKKDLPTPIFPEYPIAFPVPSNPVPLPEKPSTGFLRLTVPPIDTPVRGKFPIKIDVRERNNCYSSVHINGQLRMMSNVWPAEFVWDTTRENNGACTVEVSIWADEKTLLDKQSLEVEVKNTLTAVK